MPHVNSSGGDDLASTDEVKVYHDEGEDEERSSENLSEDKLGLLTETEEVFLPFISLSSSHSSFYGYIMCLCWFFFYRKKTQISTIGIILPEKKVLALAHKMVSFLFDVTTLFL